MGPEETTAPPEPEALQPGQVVRGYEIAKPLGKGKFSIVYMAQRLSDNLMCTLKRINIYDYDMMVPKHREKCLKEVRLLQSLDHPNIVKLLDSFVDSHDLLIILEWAEQGDLKRQLRKALAHGTTLREADIWKYGQQLSAALEHMHGKRIMHRDLKPANIFMTLNGTLKLGDLGLGRFLSTQTLEAFSKVGTPLYMSPEVLHGAGYGMKSDVWSLGCVIYEMAMLRSPFKSDQKLSLFDLFVRISQGQYPPLTESFSPELREFVTQMLELEPSKRLDASQAFKICSQRCAALASEPTSCEADADLVGAKSEWSAALVLMDDVVEKLKVLDCEERLLRHCGFPLLHSCFFLQKQPLPGKLTQATVTHEIMNWLLTMLEARERPSGRQLACPRQEAGTGDASAGPCHSAGEGAGGAGASHLKRPVGPGAATAGGDAAAGGVGDDADRSKEMLQSLVARLQARRVSLTEASLTHLQQGFGDGVCIALNELLDQELSARNFHFLRPRWEASAEIQVRSGSAVCSEVEEELEEVMSQPTAATPPSQVLQDFSDREKVQTIPLEPMIEAVPVDPVAWKKEVRWASHILSQSSIQDEVDGWRSSVKRLRDYSRQALAAIQLSEGAGSSPSSPSQAPRVQAGAPFAASPTEQSPLSCAVGACQQRLAQDLSRYRTLEGRLGTSTPFLVQAAFQLADLQQRDAKQREEIVALQTVVTSQSEELAALELKLDEAAAAQQQEAFEGPERLRVLRAALQRLQAEDRELCVRVGSLQGELLARGGLGRQPLSLKRSL